MTESEFYEWRGKMLTASTLALEAIMYAVFPIRALQGVDVEQPVCAVVNALVVNPPA